MQFPNKPATPFFNDNKAMAFDKLSNWAIAGFILFMVLYYRAVGGNYSAVFDNIFTILYLGGMAFGTAILFETRYKSFIGYGQSKHMNVAIIIGAVFGVVVILIPAVVAALPEIPFLSSIFTAGWASLGLTDKVLFSIYTAIIIAQLESRVYARILPVILNNSINNDHISAVLASILFGIIHMFVLGTSVHFIIGLILFNIIYIYGNNMFQSGAFSDYGHMFNNGVKVIKCWRENVCG